MKKKRDYYLSRLSSGEAGQALIIVLIFLLLGSLTLVPTLAHIGTALKTGEIYEKNTNEIYAADSGIEDAIWQIKYDQLEYVFIDQDYHPYKYNTGTDWSYTMANPVNSFTPNISIERVWIPERVDEEIEIPSFNDIQNAVNKNKLMVSGTATSSSTYNIIITFTPDTEAGDNLTIKSVGIWLPYGFSYVPGSSNMEGLAHMFDPYYSVPDVFPHCGGWAIVWDLPSAPPLTSFPLFTTDAGVQSARITFNYTSEVLDDRPVAIAWMETDDSSLESGIIDDILPVTWDIDTMIYKITSLAGTTEVEAYASRCKLRDMNDAIAGDYIAIGNSLMTGTGNVKTTLLGSSSTTVSESSTPGVTSVPPDADVLAAYLYWSGWKREVDRTDLLIDTGDNWNNWNRSTQQTRIPTGDGDIRGTWTTSPYWSKVDETIPNDTDYIKGVATTGTPTSYAYQLFTFSSFSIPSGSSITDLTIYVRARDDTNGTNDIRPYVKVNGSYYNPATGNNPPNQPNWTTYSYTWTTNPNTSSAWTVDDINGVTGTGHHPLQQFGVYSNDLDPDVQVSMVYAEVTYNSCWSLSSGQFRGQGSGTATTDKRTLTLKNSLTLSSYASGSVGIAWNQSVGGTLEDTDTLYFAFSGDGGAHWSSDIEAFHGGTLNNPFLYPVPDAYKTSNFKMRFYFNSNSSSKYVYLDNIRVSYMPGDTSITFKIKDTQTLIEHTETITASKLKTMVNPYGGTGSVAGYSYSCYRDVTDLVQTYPEDPGELHHTGAATYTVGGVGATVDTGHDLSYAGWSLIIVYASPLTGGHYLYLWDPFAFHPGTGQNLDFDYDGQPGGDISGFYVPDPIRDKDGKITETVAARLTCFVGEGDAWRYDEYLQIKGATSNNTMYLSNNNPITDLNVWNSWSPGMTQGIDVDTFEIKWKENEIEYYILRPKDTSLHLNMVSGSSPGDHGDAFNLIYIILSVRSKTYTGGTSSYVIHG